MTKKSVSRGISVILAVLALSGAVFAQDAGKWTHGGGVEGSTSTAFPPGTFTDSWEGGKSTSAAGKAFFKITYGQRNWDIGFKIETNETAFAGSQMVLNWNSEMAGLYLETGLGVKPGEGILGAFAFGKLTAWMFLLERQAEVRLLYKEDGDHVKAAFVLPGGGGGDGWTLGGVRKDGVAGGFRVMVTPYQITGLTFGAVAPIPSVSETKSFDTEVLGRTHLFVGYEGGGIKGGAGYWMATGDDPVASYALGAVKVGLPLKMWVVEQFKADQLNHWETGGAVANWLSLGDIPVPWRGTLKVSWDTRYDTVVEAIWNKFTLDPRVDVGPVKIEPSASYEMDTFSNEIKSGVTATYELKDVPTPSSSLTAKLAVREEGITTMKRANKDTTIAVTPSLEFFTVVVPAYVGFQMDASAPIITDITDSSRSTTTLNLKPYLAFNLRRQAIGRNKDFNGGTNQLYLLASAGYDFTKDEVAFANLQVGFKFEW